MRPTWCPTIAGPQVARRTGRRFRSFKDGVVSTGERELVPEEADIIRRIFKAYIAGRSGVGRGAGGRPSRRPTSWQVATLRVTSHDKMALGP